MTLYVFISLRGLGIHKRGVSLALVGETDTMAYTQKTDT